MNLSDIKINPTFENLLPPLTDEEFLGLEEDIVKRRKILNPILVWSKGNFIVDGHNRYKILIAHKIDNSNIDVLDFDSEADVIEWIYNNQKNRRNLTKSQLVHVWSEWEKQVAKEAKERQAEYHGNQHDGGLSSNLNEVQKSEPIRTAAMVAKKIGVSENTYRDMKLIKESGDTEKIARMDKGGQGNGVSRIANEIRNNVPNGYRQCSRCGEIKPIDEMSTGHSYNYCKKCHAQMRADSKRKHSGRKLNDFPVDFHPDTQVIVTDEMVIEAFASVFNQSVDLLESTFASNKFHMSEAVTSTVTNLFNSYISTIQKLFNERGNNEKHSERF